jgi:hypothetical protein
MSLKTSGSRTCLVQEPKSRLLAETQSILLSFFRVCQSYDMALETGTSYMRLKLHLRHINVLAIALHLV